MALLGLLGTVRELHALVCSTGQYKVRKDFRGLIERAFRHAEAVDAPVTPLPQRGEVFRTPRLVRRRSEGGTPTSPLPPPFSPLTPVPVVSPVIVSPMSPVIVPPASTLTVSPVTVPHKPRATTSAGTVKSHPAPAPASVRCVRSPEPDGDVSGSGDSGGDASGKVPTNEWSTQRRRRRGKPRAGAPPASDGSHVPRRAVVYENPAVILTAPIGASYAEALKKARGELAGVDHGAEVCGVRRTRQGAFLIEARGDIARLEVELARILPDFRVHRAAQREKVVISEVDASAEEEDVVVALAKYGVVAERIQLRKSRGGWQTAVILVSTRDARSLLEVKRITIAWSSCRIRASTGPDHGCCYRCLRPGHVEKTCSATVDFRGVCHRCGRGGHRASGCRAPPCCPRCTADGVLASHAFGQCRPRRSQ